jgi:hypothetical protein
VLSARRDLLLEALADESAQRHPEVLQLLHRLARDLSGEPPTLSAAAGRA